MSRHKKSRRSQRGGGWFGPDDPYAQKKSWMDSLSSWWSGTSTGTSSFGTSSGTGLLSTAENNLSSFASNISNTTSQALNNISSPSTYQSSSTSSYSAPSPPATSYSAPAAAPAPANNDNLVETYGGKRRRRTLKMKRRMKGGRGLGLSYYATPVSGLNMAEPTYFMKYGGKRRKSRRHKKH
jgi:hypothetical protein